VHVPEQVVPFGANNAAERRESVGETALDVVADEDGDLPGGDVAAVAAPGEVHGDDVLGLRYDGLRGGHDLEQRALGRQWVGTDDDGPSAVAEQALVDERLEAPLLGPVEEQDGDLGADDEHARAAVVLGQVPGEAQRGGAREAAVEVEHGAAHGRAEAQERDQTEVDARDVRAGVGGDDEVRDVGGRAAPLGDGLPAGLRGELRHGGLDDVQPRVEGRRGVVEELRVRAQQLLGVVQVALLHAQLLAWAGDRGTRRHRNHNHHIVLVGNIMHTCIDSETYVVRAYMLI